MAINRPVSALHCVNPKLRFFGGGFLLAVKDTNGMTWRNWIFALSSSPIPDSLHSALWFPLNYACGLYFSYQALPCCVLSVSLTLRSCSSPGSKFLPHLHPSLPPPFGVFTAPSAVSPTFSAPFHPLGLLVVRVCSRILIGQFGDLLSGLFFSFLLVTQT